jgi:hypothetical protein
MQGSLYTDLPVLPHLVVTTAEDGNGVPVHSRLSRLSYQPGKRGHSIVTLIVDTLVTVHHTPEVESGFSA